MKSMVASVDLDPEQKKRLVLFHAAVDGVTENPGPQERKFFLNLANDVKQGLAEYRVDTKRKMEHALTHMSDWAQGKPVPTLPQLVGKEREALFAELNAMTEAVASGNIINITEKIL